MQHEQCTAMASHLQLRCSQQNCTWLRGWHAEKFCTCMTIVTEICEKILTQMTFGQTGCNINQSTTDPATNTTYCETCIMATVLKGDMMHSMATWTNPLSKIHSHNFCVPFFVRGIKNYMFFVVYMVNFNKVVMNMWNRTVWFYCTSVIVD